MRLKVLYISICIFLCGNILAQDLVVKQELGYEVSYSNFQDGSKYLSNELPYKELLITFTHSFYDTFYVFHNDSLVAKKFIKYINYENVEFPAKHKINLKFKNSSLLDVVKLEFPSENLFVDFVLDKRYKRLFVSKDHKKKIGNRIKLHYSNNANEWELMLKEKKEQYEFYKKMTNDFDYKSVKDFVVPIPKGWFFVDFNSSNSSTYKIDESKTKNSITFGKTRSNHDKIEKYRNYSGTIKP